MREAAPYLGIGTTFAATVGLGLAAGHWLDRKFGTDPILLLVGGMVGLFAAFVHFYTTVSGGKR